MVAQKFEIVLEEEKRSVRGSALVTLSDTKQGFTVPRGKQTKTYGEGAMQHLKL